MPKPPLKPERIGAGQAAAILGIGKRTVQGMALRGELPNAAKIGGLWTFDEAALRSFIEERVQRPKIRQPAHTRAELAYRTLSDAKIERELEQVRLRLRERAKNERR